MFITYKYNSRGTAVWILNILVLLTLLTGSANGQTQQGQPEKLAYGVDRANVPDAISKVKSGEFSGIHVDLIARANAVEAIPILEQQFNRVEDQLTKAKIAAALVRLGDNDNKYWDFLVKLANQAVESNMPDLMSYDSQGKPISSPSPEFTAWAKANNITSEEQMYLPLAAVGLLGWSRNPRAVPVLRRALSSPNYQIESFAALGLAEIGDQDSIPFIIGACRKAPAEPAAAIARALVYFDENSAQTAVDQFIPKDLAKVYRDAKASGDTKPLSPPLYDKPPRQ